MLDWMLKEAERSKIPPHGYCGGILLDEMSIQVGHQMTIELLIYIKKLKGVSQLNNNIIQM